MKSIKNGMNRLGMTRTSKVSPQETIKLSRKEKQLMPLVRDVETILGDIEVDLTRRYFLEDSIGLGIINRFRFDLSTPEDLEIIESNEELRGIIDKMEVVGHEEGQKIINLGRSIRLPIRFEESPSQLRQRMILSSLIDDKPKPKPTSLEDELKRLEEVRLKFSKRR